MTKQTRLYLFMSMILFFSGILFYGLYNEIILIRLPSKKNVSPLEHSSSTRKNIRLFFWHNDSVSTEEKELIYSTNDQITLFNIIAGWLSVAQEEGFIKKNITLESVMLDSTAKEAFISFTQSPLSTNQSTQSKLMTIEALLKTLREAAITIKQIRFLVHFKPLNDPHLDFTHSWPLDGYMND